MKWKKGVTRMQRGSYRQAAYVFTLYSMIGLLMIATALPVPYQEKTNATTVDLAHDIRLFSLNATKYNSSLITPRLTSHHPQNFVTADKNDTYGIIGGESAPPRNRGPRFSGAANFEVGIDVMSPNAIEKNKTRIDYQLNFTLGNVIGQDNSSLVNLTISNGTDFLITSWNSWTNFQNDQYYLHFWMNDSTIALLDLGSYDLYMYVKIWDGEAWINSVDSTPLPMKDLRVDLVLVTPPEFNNKLDTDQLFNLTVHVQEHDGTVLTDVSSLSSSITPNVTVHSSNVPNLIGLFDFVRFIQYNSPSGFYTFEANLTSNVATQFDEAIHTINATITSYDGIQDFSNVSFEAKGTVYLIELTEFQVENRNIFNPDILTSGGSEHVDFRLNVNDSFHLKYEIIDNTTETIAARTHLVEYQDPNRPEDIFALILNTSLSDGTGALTLTANDISPSNGYTLTFFVRGHRTSQELKPFNVSIYWDLLSYNYTYQDNLPVPNVGTSSSLNPKALGVDIGENWTLQLAVQYASDGSPAQSAHISYRFRQIGATGVPWENLTDGSSGDIEDGEFSIINFSSLATVLTFESQIINGSNLAQWSTNYVNKTVDAGFFSLNVTWTFLVVDMIPRELDARLGTGEVTGINISAYWAHDSTSFTGILRAKGHDRGIQRDIDITLGNGVWLGLLKTAEGKYRYSIIAITDDPLGISKYTNSTGNEPNDRSVVTDIIWDAIYFTFSNVYDPYTPPFQQNTWDVALFLNNYDENATLYVYARHSYNISANTPFIGTAVLYDMDIGQPHILTFDANGVANWTGDRTDAHSPVRFRVLSITQELNWSIKQLWSTGANDVQIIWDKVLITLAANKTYSHGDWANISVSLQYVVSGLTVDPTRLLYTIQFSNGSLYENVSWRSFLDYSLSAAPHWYNVSKVYDLDTGLTKGEIQFSWRDLEPGVELGNLIVYWIDDQSPLILEQLIWDYGNGTILIIIDATDSTELWQGTGLGDDAVILVDERFELNFPLSPRVYPLSEGTTRFVFTFQFDQILGVWGDTFQFDFFEELQFSVKVTDQGTTDFPADFDPPGNNTISSNIFSMVANYDPIAPVFKDRGMMYPINITYLTIGDQTVSQTVTDGEITVTVVVQDAEWSGLSSDSVLLNISDTLGTLVESHSMVLQGELGDGRSELVFLWKGHLPVGKIYTFTVRVIDIAGNQNWGQVDVEIEDKVAPRVINLSMKPREDRLLSIELSIEENGLGIDYVTIGINSSRGLVRWFNVSLQNIRGSGSQGTSEGRVVTYTITIDPGFDLLDIITPVSYSLIVRVGDRSGNEHTYMPEELRDISNLDPEITVAPLIFNQYVLIALGLVLIAGVIVGIRVTSRTVGYDVKKILVASERISHETILTLMDEYALGVTINFFDQIQGPVPVIWEPELLEDQEQVMLDLSDRSFSTLEFVGLEEEERSGTFDFSTGSYDCTALGYSFGIVNPEARGGKENMTIVLLLRKEWGDNLLVFQDELLEKIRIIRQMIVDKKAGSMVKRAARELREFVSKLMIAFEQTYKVQAEVE